MGLKSNRLVNKPHIQICKLDIPEDGLKVHLKGYGCIKLFRFAGKNGRVDYIGTSRLDLTKEQVKSYFERRWSIEVMQENSNKPAVLAAVSSARDGPDAITSG